MNASRFPTFPYIFCGLLFAFYIVNFFFLGFLIGPFDYDHLSGYYEIAYRFWKTQPWVLPEYNPYLCGGRTLGGDPQIPIYNPLILLVPILGPALLIKLEMLTQLALGLFVFWKLLDRYGVKKEDRWWGLFLFAAGGGVISRFLVGHVTMGFLFLFPAIFYLSYILPEMKKVRRRKYLLGYWLLFIYCGLYKPNFIVYAIPVLGLEVFLRSLLKKDYRIALYFSGGVLFCVLINAINYLPAWKYFSDFPRVDGSEPHFVPPYTFLANLLLPLKAIPKAWYGTAFFQRHEYNIFLGPVALWLAFVGISRSRKDAFYAEKACLLFFVVVSAVLGFGTDRGEWSVFVPYTWFRELWPGFKSIRVAPRFWFGAFFGLCVFSAIALSSWKTKDGKLSRSRLILFVIFGLIPLLAGAAVNLCKTTVLAKQSQWSVDRSYPDDIRWTTGAHDDSYRWLKQGVGVLDCVENIQVDAPSLLRVGRLLDPVTGPADLGMTSHWDDWHRFSVHAWSHSAFEVSFNINHSDYWRFDGKGAKIISRRHDLLMLSSDGTPIEGTLTYTQPLMRQGMWISMVSLLVFFILSIFWLKKGNA